ncbi:MAG: GatB/YqeY domain-containing protein [bacterium]|nr:GatB/YqeY domain-containing protein [bacterium]
MTLFERLYEDMKSAMKAHEEVRLSVIRMAIAACKNLKIEKYGQSGQELSDEEVLQVLVKQIKQRRDAIQSYTDASRPELADKEHVEAKIIQDYLPDQMSEEDIRTVILRIKDEIGVTSASEMGKLMKPVMLELKDKADGSVVQKIVKEVLS